MAQFTPQEYVSLILFLTVWYTFNPLYVGASSRASNGAPTIAFTQLARAAQGLAPRVTGKQARFAYAQYNVPSSAAFFVAQFIADGVLAVSAFAYWSAGDATSEYTATLVLFTIHLVLNKTWPTLLFQLKSPTWTLVIVSALLLTSAAIQILIGLSIGASTAAFWLFAVFLVWVIVEFAYVIRFVVRYNEMTDEEALGAIARGFDTPATEPPTPSANQTRAANAPPMDFS